MADFLPAVQMLRQWANPLAIEFISSNICKEGFSIITLMCSFDTCCVINPQYGFQYKTLINVVDEFM